MDLEEKVEQLSNLAERQRQNDYKKEVVEFYTSIISHSYDKASSYSNLIIMAGYALFFTFWSNIRGEIGAVWGNRSAALVIVSALVFILWEIAGMISSSLLFKKLYDLGKVAPDRFQAEAERVRKETEKFQARWARWWILELILTIVPGFLGAFILVLLYVPTLHLW